MNWSQEPVVIFIAMALAFVAFYSVLAIRARLRSRRAKLERDRAAIIETIRRAAERDG